MYVEETFLRCNSACLPALITDPNEFVFNANLLIDMSFATFLFFKWIFSAFYAVYLPFLKCTALKANSSAKIATRTVCTNFIHDNCVKVIFEREALQQLRSYQVQLVSLRTFEILFIFHLLKALKSYKGTYLTMLPKFLD